LTTTYKFKD